MNANFLIFLGAEILKTFEEIQQIYSQLVLAKSKIH
jgi:hypothetical protein